jgi:glycosyltransferase involved in cell wall biosynthesis
VSPCIWFVSKYIIIPSAGEPAGRAYGLVREFARLGYKSVIITSDSMGKFDAPVAEDPIVIKEREGVAVCRVRTLKYADSKSIRRVLSWVDFEWRVLLLPKGALPAPDAIIVSSLSLLTVLNGLRLRRRYKCRLIFEVRDIWPLTLVEHGGFSERNPFVLALGAVERVGYCRADTIVGTMPNLGAHVEKVTGCSLPTSCIPQGVDVEAIRAPKSLPADYVTAYIPAGEFLVAYAGSIGIANAMDVFFECAESMQQIPDIRFVVLGDGENRQSYIDRYGSLPNLTFAPHVPKSQVHDFLSRCDLLFWSAHKSAVYDYGISLNKVVDYMLASKPIVASYSGYRSMIDEAECGTFVPAGDAAALRDEILRYAGMAAENRKVMGERGLAWLLEHRSFEVLAKEYLTILFPEEGPDGVFSAKQRADGPMDERRPSIVRRASAQFRRTLANWTHA